MWKDRLAGEREEKGSHTVRAEYRSENSIKVCFISVKYI